MIASHAMPSALFFVLVIGASVLFWRAERKWSYFVAAGFVAMCVPIAMLGYQITIPFLVLGAVAIMASTVVSYLFERARRFNDQALGQKA